MATKCIFIHGKCMASGCEVAFTPYVEAVLARDGKAYCLAHNPDTLADAVLSAFVTAMEIERSDDLVYQGGCCDSEVGVTLERARQLWQELGRIFDHPHFDCRDGEVCSRCGVVVKRDGIGREIG